MTANSRALLSFRYIDDSKCLSNELTMEALRMAENPSFAVKRVEFDAETSLWVDVKKAH